MTNFSAIIPAVDAKAANAELEAQGFGPDNFSVPTKSASATGADYAGLHTWSNDAFEAAVRALPYDVEITEGTGTPNYQEACEKQALEWNPYKGDPNELPMIGDERAFSGKTWVSLVDFNVWQPPVAWREKVQEGYPEWQKPTGSHDSYSIGDRVAFQTKNYESKINGNVWSPSEYPPGWLWLE